VNLEEQERLVEFKLILAEMAEAYILTKLAASAREQGRRLPKEAGNLVRTGTLGAVGSLEPADLAAFATSPDWESSVAAAIESGVWRRLLDSAVRLAFTPSVV
jgi:hypothetical protein